MSAIAAFVQSQTAAAPARSSTDRATEQLLSRFYSEAEAVLRLEARALTDERRARLAAIALDLSAMVSCRGAS